MRAATPAAPGHRRSIASSRAVSLARERLADLLGAETPDELVFTKNATEALNLAILGLAPEGGRIVTTSLEHNSVMRPLRELERQGHCSIEIVHADGNTGEIDLDEWAAPLGGGGRVPGGRDARLERHRRAAPDRASSRRSPPGGRPLRRRRLAERRAHPARTCPRSARRRWRCPGTRACSGRPAPGCSTSRRASRSSR